MRRGLTHNSNPTNSNDASGRNEFPDEKGIDTSTSNAIRPTRASRNEFPDEKGIDTDIFGFF